MKFDVLFLDVFAILMVLGPWVVFEINYYRWNYYIEKMEICLPHKDKHYLQQLIL